MKTYILVGEIEGNVSYGVDMSCYIFGVYQDENTAKEQMDRMKDCQEPVRTDKQNYLTEDSLVGDIREHDQKWYEEANRICEERGYKPIRKIKYSDVHYRIVPFEGLPVYCAGATYLE